MTDKELEKAARQNEAHKGFERLFEKMGDKYKNTGVVTHRITSKGDTSEDTPKVSNGGGFV